MPLSDRSNHSSSDQHKNKTKQQQVWCENCGKYISDKTRHLQCEIHTLRSRNNATQNTPAFAFGNTLHGVEVIANEKTYIKLRVNPTSISSQNLEHNINELLNKNYFPRYKYH